MSHDKVVGFCEPNKCKVEVPNKEEYDIVAGKVEGFDSRISTLETYSRSAYVKLTTTANNTIGSYSVITSSGSTSASTSFSSLGSSAVSGPTLTISDISFNLKDGFKALELPSISIDGTFSLSANKSSTRWGLFVYLNGTQIASVTYFSSKISNPSVSFSDIVIKSGDVITTKCYETGGYSSSGTATLTLSGNMSGDLYLG